MINQIAIIKSARFGSYYVTFNGRVDGTHKIVTKDQAQAILNAVAGTKVTKGRTAQGALHLSFTAYKSTVLEAIK